MEKPDSFASFKSEAGSDDGGFEGVNPFYITFVAFGVILPVMAAVGTVCNAITMVILWRGEMRSNVVYFLRALAVTDTGILIMAVAFLTPVSWVYYLHTPSLMYYFRQWYPFIYGPIYFLFQSVNLANIWITVAIAMERFIKLMFPFKANALLSDRRCIQAVFGIVVFCCVYCIPYALIMIPVECQQQPPPVRNTVTNVTAKTDNASAQIFSMYKTGSLDYDFSTILVILFSLIEKNEASNFVNAASKPCYQIAYSEFAKTLFWQYYQKYGYIIVFNMIPLFIIISSSGVIIKELRKMIRKRSFQAREENEETGFTIVLIIIVLVFILCRTTPVVSQFKPFKERSFNDFVLLSISNLCVVLNSSVNFLIYSTFGRKFRKSLIHSIRKISTSVSSPRHTNSMGRTTSAPGFSSTQQHSTSQVKSIVEMSVAFPEDEFEKPRSETCL